MIKKFNSIKKYHFITYVLLVFCCPALNAQTLNEFTDNEIEYIKKYKSETTNATVINSLKNRFAIIGEISLMTLSKFQDAIERYPNINTVVIDSNGGEVDASIEIANIISKNKMTLIVNGRCFSSCAEFIFFAAHSKFVAKYSLIGIHENQFSLYNKGQIIKLSGNETYSALLKLKKQSAIELYENNKKLIRNFQNEYSVNLSLINAYYSFISRQKVYYGDDSLNIKDWDLHCPEIKLWLLNREQLELMGVKGINSFWFPSSEFEKVKSLEFNRNMKNNVFFGQLNELNSFCTLPRPPIEDSIFSLINRKFTNFLNKYK